MELRGSEGSLQALPQKRSGGALQACRRGDVEVRSSGALEMRCRRCLFASRALEFWRYAAGV